MPDGAARGPRGPKPNASTRPPVAPDRTPQQRPHAPRPNATTKPPGPQTSKYHNEATETSSQAMVLSSGYALGLGLPFLGLAVLLDRALILVRRMQNYVRIFQWASGLLLIAIGILMLTNRITLIAIWAQRNGLFLDLPLGGGASVPTYLAAVAAGALSFLSPCVLPLVPAYLGYLSGQGTLANTKTV